MNKYIIRNCPAHFFDEINGKPKCWQKWEQFDESCQNCTDCLLKQIVELCKEKKVINCNIDGKEQILKAYYHTHLGDKILKLLDIQEVE